VFQEANMTSRLRSALLLLAACGLGPFAALSFAAQPAAAQAPPVGKASGTVTIDGKAMKVVYAYAWAEPNTFEPTKNDVVILLTDKPVPAESFGGVDGLMGVGRRLDHFALYGIDDTGKLNREVIAHPVLGDQWIQMSGATRASFTKKTLSAQRVVGSIVLKSPETVLGHRYAVKIDVDAAVVAAPRPEPLPDAKTGTPLPAAGGEPGKAYLALYRAVAKKDITTALGLFRKAGRTAKDEADLKEGIDFMAEIQPKNVRVVRGYLKGDRAALHVEGVEGKEKQYGTIEMVREDGAWRVGKQQWSNTPSK
jgi:hypothetical protein